LICKRLATIVPAIILAACLAGCQPAEVTSPSLSVGAAEAIITPTRDADAIHDDLFVRALVISDGETTLAIITADMLVISRGKVAEIQAAIHEATSIAPEDITINVSHTHNTRPRSDGGGDWGDGLTYDEWLTQQFVAVVSEAYNSRRPATLRVDRVPVQVGFNRRLLANNGDIWMVPNPRGVHPAWSDTLGAYGRDDDARIGFLFTYAAHPVVVHESSDLITADVPGATIREMQSIVTAGGQLPLEGVFMFGQGCGGNANMYPLRGGHDACNAVGRDFATTIAMLNDPVDIAPGPLRSRDLQLSLPYRSPPSVEEVELLMATSEDDPRFERLMQFAQAGDVPRFREYHMRAMAVGDELCILSLPAETFAEYQLYAVDVSPFEHTIVLGFCNGGDGYVATAADYELNAATDYEAGLTGNSFGRNTPLPLDASVEGIIQAGIRQLLADLKAGD
jgi:neutral ceramidase